MCDADDIYHQGQEQFFLKNLGDENPTLSVTSIFSWLKSRLGDGGICLLCFHMLPCEHFIFKIFFVTIPG